MNSILNIFFKFLVLNANNVTKSIFALFATLSKANLLRITLDFHIVQSTWPPSWISKKGIVQYLWRHKPGEMLITLEKISIN